MSAPLIFSIVWFCSVLNPVSASDVEVWDQPLTHSDYMGVPFASLDTGRSPIYENSAVFMQKAPALHPYHPSDDIVGGDLPHTSVAVKIPLEEVFDRIPTLFQEEIHDLGGHPCDFYISFQNLPYSMDRNIVHRPQYWMFPNAEATMLGSLEETITIVALGRGLEIAGYEDGILRATKVVSVHGPSEEDEFGDPHAILGESVLSGGQPLITTRDKLLNRPLWVLTTASPGTERMRSSLSLFFPLQNGAHSFLVQEITKEQTLRSIYSALSDSIYGSSMLSPLKLLMGE